MIREHCSLYAAFKNVGGWDQGGFAAKWNVTNPNWPEGGVHGGGDLQYVPSLIDALRLHALEEQPPWRTMSSVRLYDLTLT